MKPEFFKVYIVRDDLKTIWIRDCFKLTETYAYMRPTRSPDSLKVSYCITIKFSSSRYFRTLKEAKTYIKEQNQIKINKLKFDIEKAKKSIQHFKSLKNQFEFVTDFDYDDRVNYSMYL